MAGTSKRVRHLEIGLLVLGVSLLGVAVGDVLFRWHYQSQQERALYQEPALLRSQESRPIAPRSQAVALQREVVASTTAKPPVPIVETTASEKKKARAMDDLDPAAIGRIEIPRLGVTAIVEEGADKGTLARAVGLIPGSARPGELGNMVLAGHRDTFFRPLRKIKLNDRIRMIVPPHTFEYRVQSLRVVEPEETSVLQSNGVEELTLITCYPFRFIGPAPERFIVSAMRVN